MPSFFRNNHGAVISFTIDKYITVLVNNKFDGNNRISYSKTENVDNIDKIEHDLVRETLKQFNVSGLEIVSISDIPGEGTGLGSSSAFTVGLIYALYAHKNWSHNLDPGYFAEIAYTVERRRCGHPVGKQDHYSAAYGGLHYYQFNEDDSVVGQLIGNDGLRRLAMRNFIMFYTGKTRQSRNILARQEAKFSNTKHIEIGLKMRDLAKDMRDDLIVGNWKFIGEYLHENWLLKKQLDDEISDAWIDGIYEKARKAGAVGGKILGAGGGGFFLFYAPMEKHGDIERAIGLRRVMFEYEEHGAQIMEGW